MRSHLSPIRDLALVFSLLAAMTTGCEPPPDEDEAAWNEVTTGPVPFSVVPIFFVPTDWPVGSAEVQKEQAAISAAVAEIHQYYLGKLGGRSFRINPLTVVQANGAKEAYGIQWNGGNIYTDGINVGGSFEGAVIGELFARGFPTPPGQNQSGHAALIFVKGAGGWAGGREFSGANGGWALLGDWCIDSLAGDVPEGAYWWSGSRKQKGAAAHELGHAFGLPHPASNMGGTTIMGNWWDYPTIGFNADNLVRLFGEEKRVFFPHFHVSAFDQSMNKDGQVAQIAVTPGRNNYFERVYNGAWGAWQSRSVAALGIAGLTAIRFANYRLTTVPTRDFLNLDGTTLYSQGFVNGSWQPATATSVASLGIAGVTKIRSFDQVSSNASNQNRPKQIVLSDDGRNYYYRFFQSGAWTAWTRKGTSTLKGAVALSISEGASSAGLPEQFVLNNDGTKIHSRVFKNGRWLAWSVRAIESLDVL